jgi:ElaB/YqjD/DUF883 family membrane-anchored ribosome-binding protein
MNMIDDLNDSRHRLSDELRNIVRDTEDVLRHKVHDAGEGYTVARDKLERSLNQAKKELESFETAVFDRTKRAARATDHYVHEHPWESVGLGAGIGILIGLLMGRK